ncbi:MAG TPA: PIN domain-containing protein [Pirellulaceae bacterium]
MVARTSTSARELADLIAAERAAVIGPIRQELLSGIKSEEQFDLVRDRLRAFPDVRLTRGDYELAAGFFNHCRAAGVQGSNTDFLICAVANRRSMAVFTTDQDFTLFANVVPIVLHEA